ncbi:hypothetical protein EMIHUDRAFT_444364 [Emiliania huxleyi CCMP1516]|uniref:PPM-type phosphatase domain-containing protein n=2 Tax=Emiliania huxleyi TaxID=2903 RepID=A0A0D3IQI5_EMIH1|nr:hypothetical protein EMIHUDRAFT_437104 [Emiliania huxleyi CCMP1516]XP_005774334.1 hypothetical protein EMIHUDRAFT_444364 [Emiliania huxleyi CCMP1516]EOD13520.1 hypothetical protein EMIHUDRAFT_437104 [Emiliania huxleyi CCMP1516]EOD21905.1 hypothetical protein EMIHUDRAFT_444364 [Emiliania huxleyi CCMP1516]|eukprot:XP_005765949.1 hypothetical protein EMIHUDRAFT_437104 [Emiliania huxleyi CCMP1516]
MLVMEVEEEDWPLGYDAVDGGSTASVAAIVDGRTLVYAAVGDSAGILAQPGNGEAKVEELVAEHAPVRLDEWVARLHSTGIEVVYDHPDMFEGEDQLLRVFDRDATGAWRLSEEALRRADEMGCGFKTERGDRSAVLMTPEEGRFSQMMLNVTRSLGDFYHGQYGVTWRPEVVTRDLAEELGPGGRAVLCVASDGVWDLWTFEEAMADLLDGSALPAAQPARRKLVMDFMENSRNKGYDAFGDSADNLTGIVVYIET